MRNNLKDLLEILDKAYPNSIPIRTLKEHKHEIVVINDAIKNKLVDKIKIPSLADDSKLNNNEMALKLSLKGSQYLEKIKENSFWTSKKITIIITVIGLIIAGATFVINLSESKQPKLSVIGYAVAYNEHHFKPIFSLKNVGKVPLEYEFNKSDITGISFYNGSNLVLINARSINATDFDYHNRGELLLPEAESEFSFTSTNLDVFKIPFTHFETNISMSINYWNVDTPSKICTFYSKYTFISNENKIYPIPNTQSWACN